MAFATVMAGQVMAQQDAESVILGELFDGITEAYESVDGKDKPYERFKFTDVKETVVDDHGSRCVRTIPDETIDDPDKMQNRRKGFISMSKTHYYLYVYEIK